MDQQEFVPESQEQRRQKQDGKQTSTYYQKTGNGPKEEHPSTFEDTVPPYVYRAQDSRHSSSQQAETRTNQRRTDAAAPGRGSRSSTRQQQQSHTYQRMRGTRPQYWWKPIVRWALLILLVIILIRILPFIVVLILSVLGILAVALLLPIFILLGLVAAVVIIALIVLSMLGIPIRHRSRYFHR